tara:strand:+ start:879 stop:1085 length:207 start_codon:yes stop_codon:yes gene_type:complete
MSEKINEMNPFKVIDKYMRKHMKVGDVCGVLVEKHVACAMINWAKLNKPKWIIKDKKLKGRYRVSRLK